MARETYKDALDGYYYALVEALRQTGTSIRNRPAGQLVTHLRWRGPHQHVSWDEGTTRQVPQNAAALSIHEGMPQPDAMEIAMSALAEELSGETLALAALDQYRQAVHRLNARQGVAPQRSSAGTGPVRSPSRGGNPYIAPTRAADSIEEKSSVFERNPDAIDRGTKAHMDIQNLLAEHVREAGFELVSPGDGDERFDVAWLANGVLHICEVKSLTDNNEELQLRLGLGQLLSYLCRTNVADWRGAEQIVGILAVEREPRRSDWTQICETHGVTLTWPDRFSELR